MRFPALVLVISLMAAAACLGQSAPPRITPNGVGQGKTPEVACRVYPRTTESYKRKLWDGYEISVGPAAEASGAGDDQCTGAIYDKEGRVLYRTTGFNVTFDQNLTGQDFNDDGHPEVVFQTDTGGGNHCCWTYNVISLYPKPHKLFDIDEEGAVQFERDEAGKMAIWKRVGAPDEFNGPIAGRPFAERVYRVRGDEMVDSTPEFCARIFGDQSPYARAWKAQLSPENIARLQSLDRPIENEEQIARALLERAYQHVLCRQPDEALADLDLWPASSRETMKADFAARIKDDFPDFAARLAQTSR